jgi:SWI/SNF-related matrix-associated actin-dependent regulator of chromatin subfamily A member 5
MDQARQVLPIYDPQSPTSASSPSCSPFGTPNNENTIVVDNSNEGDEIELMTTRRRSGLRQPKVNTSLRAIENGYSTPKRQHKKKSTLEQLIVGDLTPMVSERIAIRQEIASKTAIHRDRFLVEKKDFWLPLLPPNNHVRKLVEAERKLSPEQVARLPIIAPYEEIETQPKGITATMKPYQLSGLSFMVYLHRNVSPTHNSNSPLDAMICPHSYPTTLLSKIY